MPVNKPMCIVIQDNASKNVILASKLFHAFAVFG